MSTKLKCTYINRYACSKLSRQRLMTRWAQNHTLRTPRRVSIKTQSLAQPQKADAFCPMICHASALSRLGQRQISCWIVLDFVEYFCSMSGSRRISAWVLSWSIRTSMCTHVANWPSRGLCDKVGPESHIMNALPRFYRHSVTGTATKSRCILSNDLLCLHSFKDRPEADHESFKVLLNISAPHEEAEESLHEY